MNTEKYIKKDVFFAKIFIVIGLIGILIWLASGVMGFQSKPIAGVASGLVFGFIPTGIGMLIILKRAGKNSVMIKNIQIENEERNTFINTKAGQTAFWVLFWYIFISAMLSNIVSISLQIFCTFTLFFMAVVYFSLVVINHKKY